MDRAAPDASVTTAAAGKQALPSSVMLVEPGGPRALPWAVPVGVMDVVPAPSVGVGLAVGCGPSGVGVADGTGVGDPPVGGGVGDADGPVDGVGDGVGDGWAGATTMGDGDADGDGGGVAPCLVATRAHSLAGVAMSIACCPEVIVPTGLPLTTSWMGATERMKKKKVWSE